MSNYTKSTNFATKDNLTPGDPLKVVRGTEIDTEYNNIATAIATKTDNSAAAITGGAIDGATVGATTPATGAFTTLAASGTTTLAGALVGAATQSAFNTVSTTLNLGGAATALNLGAATGTATVNNTTLAAKAITASTTLAVTGTSTLTGAVTATAGVSGPITSSSVTITGGSITGITDLAVADGGTGASTAANALNNLLPSQTGNANKYLQTDGTNPSWDAVSLSTADITGTLGVANGGTGVTTSTGTTNVVLSNSPTLVTPILGTPTSATLTNATGLPIATGVSGLGTGVATFLATPSSANLAAALTDETGTGSAVFATSPTLVTPALGTPSSAVLTNATGLPNAGLVNSSITIGGTAIALGASSNALANDITVQGVTVGRGAGAVATNTAVGASALATNSTGSSNVAVGYFAGNTTTTAQYNTFVGRLSGGTNTEGGSNSFFGESSGYFVTTGANNSILGCYNGNQDSLDIRTASNYVVLSDGAGKRQLSMYEGGTVALDSAVPNAGTGITFPATQSASSNANTLDDYEEGTWTPTLSSIGNWTGTPTTTYAKYIKIGQSVFIEFLFSGTVTTGSTTTYFLTTLPITATSTSVSCGSNQAEGTIGTIIANTTTNCYVWFPASSGLTSGAHNPTCTATYSSAN